MYERCGNHVLKRRATGKQLIPRESLVGIDALQHCHGHGRSDIGTWALLRLPSRRKIDRILGVAFGTSGNSERPTGRTNVVCHRPRDHFGRGALRLASIFFNVPSFSPRP